VDETVCSHRVPDCRKAYLRSIFFSNEMLFMERNVQAFDVCLHVFVMESLNSSP